MRGHHGIDSRLNRAGLPDIIATNGKVILLAELKSMGGRVRREQQAWIAALSGVTTIVSGIFRPDRSDELYELIREGKR